MIYLTDKSIISKFTDFKVYVHYCDVIKGAMASQITSLTIVYSTVYSGTDQRKHQSSASLAIVRGIHRPPVNSPYKWPVTRKMFPFYDVIMLQSAVRYRNGVDLIPRWPLSYFQTLHPDNGPTIANDFIHSIKIYNKDCLHS